MEKLTAVWVEELTDCSAGGTIVFLFEVSVQEPISQAV